jgi:UDP-N-acetylmuramate dehydrogenase
MIQQKNKSLTKLTTFGLTAFAQLYTSLRSQKDISTFDWSQNPFVLGGGSNTILKQQLKYVVSIDILTKIIGVDHTRITITVGAGLVWKNLVLFCARKKLNGIENLAAIPGTVGGAIVQNIGAYGVELSERVISVKVYHTQLKQIITLSNSECEFGYRSSIFKRSKELVVIEVTLALSKNFTPNISFKELNEYYMHKQPKSAHELAQKITAIRRKKLPSWKKQGNCGSFFKNPIISTKEFSLIPQSTVLHSHQLGQSMVKLSAAQLIDLCGLKGVSVGGARVSKQHSLVIVNYHHATVNDVIALKNSIIHSVKEKFLITLV